MESPSDNHGIENAVKLDSNAAKLTSVIVVRPARAEDVNFVYSTWLKGLYYGNSFFRKIDQETYYDKYAKIIEALIFRGADITVAALKEDPDVIVGYAVTNPQTLHWVFVKPQWRRLGIAKLLLPPDIQTVTHITKMGHSIMPTRWRFNPF